MKRDESSWRLLWRGPIFVSHFSSKQGGEKSAFSQDLDLLCFIELNLNQLRKFIMLSIIYLRKKKVAKI